MRTEERHGKRPRCIILGYTANAQPEVRRKCLSAGMDDCLLKPISLGTLSQRLAGIRPRRQHKPRRKLYHLDGLATVSGMTRTTASASCRRCSRACRPTWPP